MNWIINYYFVKKKLKKKDIVVKNAAFAGNIDTRYPWPTVCLERNEERSEV